MQHTQGLPRWRLQAVGVYAGHKGRAEHACKVTQSNGQVVVNGQATTYYLEPQSYTWLQVICKTLVDVMPLQDHQLQEPNCSEQSALEMSMTGFAVLDTYTGVSATQVRAKRLPTGFIAGDKRAHSRPQPSTQHRPYLQGIAMDGQMQQGVLLVACILFVLVSAGL